MICDVTCCDIDSHVKMKYDSGMSEVIDIEKVAQFWLVTAERDWRFAGDAFAMKHYPHALFFVHLTLEKLFKALVALKTRTHAPWSHNLLDLARKAALELTEEQRKEFDEITSFNVEARYPDEKYAFYRRAGRRAYAEHYFNRARHYRLWLKREIIDLRQKKR